MAKQRSLKKMKDPVKLSIILVVMATIGLVISFLVTRDSSEVIEESDSNLTSFVANDHPEPSSGEPIKEDDFTGPGRNAEDQTSGLPEDDIAIPVEGDPLTVTLLYYPHMGQISIERYNEEGNPTGEPLKSGTKVQIPNPSIPGEKIHFTVP